MTLAAWPGSVLPIRTEFKISGTWTDVTPYVRAAKEIVISGRGRSSEQGEPVPSTCSLTLNNADGRFSNRNPSSPYYGLLPRNLPMRVSVTEDRSFAILDVEDDTVIRTADKAILRVTGDFEVRIEFDAATYTQGTLGYHLASRYRRTASANRSWVLFVNSKGYPQLNWSTDGSSGALRSAICTAVLPVQYGPIALRAKMDVNNGAGGCTVTFLTSDTITGTWTQLGDPVIGAGTTSIHAGNADLELGRIDDGLGAGITGVAAFTGRIYGFEMYSDLVFTLVARARVYEQTRGTTSWSDGLGTPNTWLVEGGAEITPDNRRFTGEISAFPLQWDLTGNDVWVPLEAADVRRRLTKGAVPLTSALLQYFSTLGTASTTTGYWPAEDGTTATTLANVALRGAAGRIIDCQFGTASDLPASAGTITLSSTSSRIFMTGKVIANTGYASFNVALKMSSVPASEVDMVELTMTGGTVGRVRFSITATTYDLELYDTDGASLTSVAIATGGTTPAEWIMFVITVRQAGGNVQSDLGWYQQGGSVLYGGAPAVFAGTAGRYHRATITGSTNNVGTQYAHMFMSQFLIDNTTAAYLNAVNSFDGESSIDRFERVCGQIGVTPYTLGDPAYYETMGAQIIDTPMNVLDEVARTEQGFIYPDRNSLGLVMRTRRSLINQYGPQIDYSADELGPPVPQMTDDDGLLRNAVTATRWDGSTGFATQDAGPNSTALPTATPPGVGTAPASISRNPYESERLTSLAAWDMFLGTWDEPRWPSIAVMLERQNYTGTATKISKGHNLARLDVGDRFSLTNLPAFIPPDEILLLVQGVTEVLGNRSWRLIWNTSPLGPYIGNDLIDGGNGRYRAGTTESTITANFTSSVTGASAFQITIAADSALWGTTALRPDNFPLDVLVGGEVITLSAITGTSSPQTVDVSARAVNGVTKAHVAGETINVLEPFPALL